MLNAEVCVRCAAETSPADHTCARCGAALRAVATDTLVHYDRAHGPIQTAIGALAITGGLMAGAIVAQTFGLAAGVAALLGVGVTPMPVAWLGPKARRVSQTIPLRWLLLRAGAPRRIGDVRAGLVRVRGRVQVLGTVATPHESVECGAYVERGIFTERCDCSPHCNRVATRIVAHRGLGRILVSDDTGVALVDPGSTAFDVRRREQIVEPERTLGSVIVKSGSDVEIVGRATLGAASDVARYLARGYRETPTVLYFSGTDDEPVLVLV